MHWTKCFYNYRPLGQGNIFRNVCQEFCPGGGVIPACIAGGIPACLAAGLWGVVSQHACSFQAYTRGGKLRGLAWGGLQAHTQGGFEGLCLGVSRPTPKGGFEESDLQDLQVFTWGVSRPTPGEYLQAHTKGGCIPACAEANTPQRPLLWVVRILLECILVKYNDNLNQLENH